MATVLVVDDEERYLKIYSMNLSDAGYQVHTANSVEKAIQLFEESHPSAVITDLKMPKQTGEDLLNYVSTHSPHTPVIILTAYGDVQSAVAMMRRGAFHYLLKPVEMDELKLFVDQAVRFQQLTLEVEYLREQDKEREGFEGLIGQSPSMMQLFALIDRVAKSDSTVLILGQSGTGKEMVAQAIHRRSSRSSGAFIPTNCIALPRELLESEMFGHVRGSFTGAVGSKVGKFELADKGTLFLDEIGDMDRNLQGKILRVLQDGSIEPVGATTSKKVDVRVLAATNCDLQERVRQGAFREDLFYRLNVVPVVVPPLHDRQEDIPVLVQHFLQKKAQGKTIPKIPSQVIQALMRYSWPGNVRELENLIERFVVLESLDVFRAVGYSLPAAAPPVSTQSSVKLMLEQEFSYKDAKAQVVSDFDREFLTEALKKANGNITRAAEIVGMDRKNFSDKLSEIGVDAKKFKNQ
ncbi:MAG TPA: sigma-54 dependent transcriptional regulator [bacterium]|nr:sigma-54 dependent transcriptional regulator [bacterium]